MAEAFRTDRLRRDIARGPRNFCATYRPLNILLVLFHV